MTLVIGISGLFSLFGMYQERRAVEDKYREKLKEWEKEGGELPLEYEIKDVKVNNANIKLVGVKHDEEYFNQHFYTFYNLIKNSDRIIIESDYTVDFYKDIGEICKSEGKDLYILDPCIYMNFEDRFKSDLSFFIDESFYFLFPYTLSKSITNKTSRRKFLGLSFLLFPAYLGSLPGIFLPNLIDRNASLTYGIDDKIMYGFSYDYRNVRFAKGLEVLSKRLGSKKNLTLFIGGAHIEPIYHYLTNPEDREIKERIYNSTFIFPLLSNTSIYRYKAINGEWKLIEEIKF